MNVDVLLSKVEDLSALAPSVVKLLDLLSRENIDNEAVVEVVRQDAVLSAKLLALANSAYFAPPTPVESLQEALFYLGYEQVHRLALAVGLGGLMNRHAAGYAMDEGQFWRHSLLTARAVELIARASVPSELTVAFTAGLLHDIGKLVLNQFLDPHSQAAVARAIEERGQAGVVAEQNILHTNHAEVGAALLRKWNLPRHIIDAVEFHHEPARTSHALAAMVTLADAMAHMVTTTRGGLSDTLKEELLKRLGLTETKYQELLSDLAGSLLEIEAVALAK